jgi:hydrogenase expression/formation protein HypE
VVEEGLPVETLRRILLSMQEAARRSGVSVVTGDTKVVDRGKGDGIFINTAGIGVVEMDVSPSRVTEGDTVILSGDVGRHGMAILAAREDLALETGIASDTAPLVDPVLRLHGAGLEVHCLRDLTRGGLATAVIEIARAARVRIDLDEDAIPVVEEVRGACELFGLDPLYVANEGRFVAFVASRQAEEALQVLPPGARAIGRVVPGREGTVTARTSLGTRRIIDMISGDQLPRIC